MSVRSLSGGLALLLLVVAGCASTYNLSSPRSALGRTDSARGNASAAAKELTAVQRVMHAGDYAMAIPRLKSIIARYPGTDAAVESRYFLGLAHAEMGGLPEALDQLNRYLELAPGGQYAESCRARVTELGEQVEQRYLTPEQLRARIAEREQQVATSPENFDAQLDLADLYWKNQQWDKAGAQYQVVLAQWPQMGNDLTVRSRMELQPDGTYLILTPAEVSRRHAEADPLVIFNTSTYRSGKNRSGWGWGRSYKDDRYNVSGQVTNRGSAKLRNVAIIVTTFGTANRVYESKTVRIGSLNPQDTRAFNLSFEGFDIIENVLRHECVGTFER